ncbi:hypothetical protein D5S17_34940 [Pseudonocardiaceae bacterium YIM PH 21723]|nr:hypothetical protein D5S17_34940 [Pseudonocardiaceae bacterium YIM PH 21723]
MIRRSRRTIVAAVTALLLLAAAAFVATWGIQLLANKPPLIAPAQVARQLHATTWDSPRVLAAAAILAVLALILAVKAMLPGRALVLPLDAGDNAEISAGVTRRGMGNALRAAAAQVPGTDSATVAAGSTRVTALVRTSLGAPKQVADEVKAALAERLTTIAPQRMPRVRVRVREQR